MTSTNNQSELPIRQRIESGFATWGHTVARHRILIIVVMLAIGALLGSQIPRVIFDTSFEAMFKRGDPTLVTYNEFRAQFGREDMIIVAIQPPEVFSLEFLEVLRKMHEAFEAEIPHLEKVTSLINARSTRGEDGELIVEDLLEDWPEGAEELEALRQRVLANPLYRDMLLSRDGSVTTIVMRISAYSSLEPEPDALAGFEDDALTAEEVAGAAGGGGDAEPAPISGEEIAAAVVATDRIVEQFRSADVEIHVSGGPHMSTRILFDMQSNIRRFIVLVLLTIAGLLFALFRRVSGVGLPLVVVVLSIVVTFGIQGIRGTAIGMPTQIVPSFLLSVGVGAAVHILVIFYQRFDLGDSAEDAIAFALGHSGLPIVMTALTTAGGLLSFLVSDVAPVADLGVLAPIGVISSLIYCLVLLPALLVALPLRRRSTANTSSELSPIARVLVATGAASVRHRHGVVAFTAVLVGFAMIGALRIEFHHDTMAWFAKGDRIRVDTEWIDRELSGTMALEVVIDTGRENGLQDPVILAKLDAIAGDIERLQGGEGLEVRKTISLADVVKEIHQALNDNAADSYAVPESRELIAQELLLFENSGSDDLEDFVDSQFQIGRFTLQLPYVAPENYHHFIPDVTAMFQEALGDDVEIRTTGFMSLLAASLDAISKSMFMSYSLALIIITPLMMLLIGTLRGGLVSMVPNLAPIVLVLGLMGWLEIPFDLFTLLIGSIAIGLAVDDTIHFMHNYYRYYRETGDVHESVRRTLTTTGQAMLVTSIVLTTGFLVYTFSPMNNLFYFGLLTALTIVLAFLADVIVSPALVAMVTSQRPED